MNVDDFNEVPTDFSVKDRLDQIFERQHELMQKYIPIEVSNGLCHTTDCPVDIHSRFGQARLKDFFWRCTEELTEAAEAQLVHRHLTSHAREELADALHFLVEACLLAGITPQKLCHKVATTDDALIEICRFMGTNLAIGRSFEEMCWSVTYDLGCASNCLKNRPWKKDQKLVDVDRFETYLKHAFHQMILLFVYVGMTPDEIFAMYFRKSEVNKFRQRSNY